MADRLMCSKAPAQVPDPTKKQDLGKLLAMKARKPAIPYPIDFDQELDTLVFFKEKHTQSDFDRITASVIQQIMSEPSLQSRDIVLWRGETGYVGLAPGSKALMNSPTMYWAPWMIPQKVPAYSLYQWIQFAEGNDKGLMLFPLSPLDIQLRQEAKEN